MGIWRLWSSIDEILLRYITMSEKRKSTLEHCSWNNRKFHVLDDSMLVLIVYVRRIGVPRFVCSFRLVFIHNCKCVCEWIFASKLFGVGKKLIFTIKQLLNYASLFDLILLFHLEFIWVNFVLRHKVWSHDSFIAYLRGPKNEHLRMTSFEELALKYFFFISSIFRAHDKINFGSFWFFRFDGIRILWFIIRFNNAASGVNVYFWDIEFDRVRSTIGNMGSSH